MLGLQVQDLQSLIKPLDACGVEMNARQRRTLRRAVERVEQELQAAASPEATDEESPDALVTAGAACAEAITAEAATSGAACPRALVA